jgi:hypothetical protein
MNNKLFLSLLGLVLTLSLDMEVKAQLNAEENAELPGETFNESLDSLLHLWYVQSTNESDLVPDTIVELTDLSIPKVADSVYIERLNNLFSPIPLPFNPHVRSYIELYTIRKRQQVQTMLGLSDYYSPFSRKCLMPKDCQWN